MSHARRGLAASAAAAWLACSPPRDTVPVMPETKATDAGTEDGYVAIAKEAHTTLALSSHSGVARDAAVLHLQHLAAEGEACAAQLDREGVLANGAGRFTAKKKGAETVVELRTEGGPRATHHAVLCVVSVLRRIPFPAGPDGSTLIIDALWGK